MQFMHIIWVYLYFFLNNMVKGKLKIYRETAGYRPQDLL